jgi:hypothetical protein
LKNNGDTPAETGETTDDLEPVKKRPYTVTPEVIEQRRNAGRKNPGGARNNWKHGLYASSLLLQIVKPCKSTCDDYPCSIVDGGQTKPGAACYEKEHLIEIVDAIISAATKQEGGQDHLNALISLELATNLMVLRTLKEAIIDSGAMIDVPYVDKDGKVVAHVPKLHPGLIALPKLLQALNISFGDYMLTPKEIEKAKQTDTGFKTLADIMSGVKRVSKE